MPLGWIFGNLLLYNTGGPSDDIDGQADPMAELSAQGIMVCVLCFLSPINGHHAWETYGKH